MTPQDNTILIVDDEPMLREIMSEWMASEGYSVLTAKNGADALRVLEANRVDAIVTDVRMPVMDGITLLRTLKASADNATPAIVVSGFSDITLREALDLGVETMLPKPFTHNQLLSSIRRLLTRREELWGLPAAQGECPDLYASFSTIGSARQLSQIAFGRGGFCLRSNSIPDATSVRFVLDFKNEPLRIAGLGAIRWAQPAEEQIGVEIITLEPDCLAQCISLTTRNNGQCFIPRSTAA